MAGRQPLHRPATGPCLTTTGRPPTVAPPPTESEAPRNCENSYPTLCIPPASEIGDLECEDVVIDGVRLYDFPVRPPDSHHFDDDQDGLGCEPYIPQ